MSEEPQMINLPHGETRNELVKLGISENVTSPFGLYELLKSIPVKDRGNIKILFGCTGGAERSRRFGNVGNKMGFDVASLANPKGYHSKFAVPIDEMIT